MQQPTCSNQEISFHAEDGKKPVALITVSVDSVTVHGQNGAIIAEEVDEGMEGQLTDLMDEVLDIVMSCGRVSDKFKQTVREAPVCWEHVRMKNSSQVTE